MTIYGLNMDGLGTDSRSEQIRRALFGSLYGFMGGFGFVFVAAFIDIWLNPALPFGVDWSTFFQRLLLVGVGLALVGAATCWQHEAWQGLLGGAAVAAAIAVLAALFQGESSAGLKFLVLLFILLPVAAIAMPVAYLLRWLTERHAAVLHMQNGTVRVMALILVAVLLGAAGGYFMKSSERGVLAAQLMNDLLQNPLRENSSLAKYPEMAQHQNLSYKLYQEPSKFSTEGFDIQAQYADGFAVRCTIVAYPGTKAFVSGCRLVK